MQAPLLASAPRSRAHRRQEERAGRAARGRRRGRGRVLPKGSDAFA